TNPLIASAVDSSMGKALYCGEHPVLIRLGLILRIEIDGIWYEIDDLDKIDIPIFLRGRGILASSLVAQKPANRGIPAYENIVMEKVIAKIGFLQAPAPIKMKSSKRNLNLKRRGTKRVRSTLPRYCSMEAGGLEVRPDFSHGRLIMIDCLFFMLG
ncbi:hypothetical protein HAX54_008519, partial [Datura stramonium]|nr:hypothetical protein [Datura stramonium]